MLWMTQCTHVIFGARGSGASGSSTMSAKVFVPCGAADQFSGGEISAPSQVYCFGMAPLLANAGDVRTSAMATISTPQTTRLERLRETLAAGQAPALVVPVEVALERTAVV